MPAGQIVMCLPIQRVHLSIKQLKSLTFWAKRAKLNASAGHIWPAGRMLCMPDLKACSRPLFFKFDNVKKDDLN